MDAQTLEQELRTYRPVGMESFPPEFIWPRYDGVCVGNLAGTAARALGATLGGALPPLRQDILGDLTDGVQRVVLLVMDALGWEQLQHTIDRHPQTAFARLAERGRLLPITTTFLSTTTSVLSTIWSGFPPVRHGLLAYEMFMREWLMAVEAISFSSVHEPFSGTLSRWGLNPKTFQPQPSIGMQLAVQGVLSFAVITRQYVQSPLSQMNFRGMRRVTGHVTGSDFWITLRRVLQEQRGGRFLLGGYWSAVDTLAHIHGPLDETGEAEIRTIGHMLETFFLDGLTAADREGTLLLLTADHGQITTPPEGGILLDDHPVLRDALFLPPLGEARVPFFYVRQGQYETVWQYLNEHFPEQFYFMSRDEVLEKELMGPGKPYVEVPHRLGDIIGIARGNTFLVRDKELLTKLNGRHGGLSSAEMLVPLLALRLDA